MIYVQPLGKFDKAQRKVLDRTAEFLGIYFQLPVKVREGLSLDVIPATARREHPTWHVPQILSTYVLDKVLLPRLPEDACACLALTTSDLWPGENWNFVFGQASLGDRVGVWSIYRNGDPHGRETAFRLCLLRTLKIASHETGHMFSMEHCTLYECNMCGSNHREEADRRPLWLCPHCLAKLCYATGADPVRRFQALAAFSKRKGLKPEQEFYQRSRRSCRERNDTRSRRGVVAGDVATLASGGAAFKLKYQCATRTNYLRPWRRASSAAAFGSVPRKRRIWAKRPSP